MTWVGFIKFKGHYGNVINLFVHSIRGLAKFPGDPYYEPLSWFIMCDIMLALCLLLLLTYLLPIMLKIA